MPDTNNNNQAHGCSDLHEAILANSQAVVSHYLEKGTNPNKSPQLAPVGVIAATTQERARDLHRTLGRVFRSRPTGTIGPLHVAVCNAYHHASSGKEEALGIIKALLEAGADTQATCNGVAFCKIGIHPSVTIASTKTASKVALFLKRFPIRGEAETACCTMMDSVASLILEADAASRERRTAKNEEATVRKETLTTWTSMWENPLYCDISFSCPDGEVQAHKAVLAAAVPYFSAAFEGPWKEGSNGEWKTDNSTNVMKGVLRFVYTGTVDEKLLENNTSALLTVAAEYQLQALQQFCEKKLVEQILVKNVKKALELAHLHSLEFLKSECFDFVRHNSVEALTHPSLMSLATENAELWQELVEAIRSRKRPREPAAAEPVAEAVAEPIVL